MVPSRKRLYTEKHLKRNIIVPVFLPVVLVRVVAVIVILGVERHLETRKRGAREEKGSSTILVRTFWVSFFPLYNKVFRKNSRDRDDKLSFNLSSTFVFRQTENDEQTWTHVGPHYQVVQRPNIALRMSGTLRNDCEDRDDESNL